MGVFSHCWYSIHRLSVPEAQFYPLLQVICLQSNVEALLCNLLVRYCSSLAVLGFGCPGRLFKWEALRESIVE